MPNMTLATDAFLLEDITLPEFYSIQFEILMVEQDNSKSKIILGLTNGDEEDREPSFSLQEKWNGNFIFITKISSVEIIEHETTVTSEWLNKWLSFKIRYSF